MTAASQDNPAPFSSDDAVRLGLIAESEARALGPLLQQCSQRQVHAGAVVLEANSSNSSAFILLEGRLSVKLQANDPQDIGQ
ncbi:MAG: hypothetical protein FJ060_11875, partial [Cyanobacteria bacterium K_Offshore_0m_m2_072]|nr:hypothetical protein [Cyanobacteria bacterium K_Offshore_0m_m2_072]